MANFELRNNGRVTYMTFNDKHMFSQKRMSSHENMMVRKKHFTNRDMQFLGGYGPIIGEGGKM